MIVKRTEEQNEVSMFKSQHMTRNNNKPSDVFHQLSHQTRLYLHILFILYLIYILYNIFMLRTKY